MKKLLALFFVLVLLASVVNAQEAAGLKVEEMIFCTGVEDRQPVGADTLFVNTVENIYCFTKISGAEGETTISHLWFFNDEQKAKVDIAVKGKTWRTWSSKQILKEWTGNWRVDVVDVDGNILLSKTFKVR